MSCPIWLTLLSMQHFNMHIFVYEYIATIKFPCKFLMISNIKVLYLFLINNRSILYNGADVVRDLEWVIFDEVHYINDASVSSHTPVCTLMLR